MNKIGIIFDAMIPVGVFSFSEKEEAFGHKKVSCIKLYSFYVDIVKRKINRPLSFKLTDNNGSVISDLGRGSLWFESVYVNRDTAIIDKAILIKGSYEN